MPNDGKDLERLVEAIHRFFDGGYFDVQRDVVLQSGTGSRSQIDVLLTPKSSVGGPTLVSCKDWTTKKVGIDHVREWATVVQEHGCPSGNCA